MPPSGPLLLEQLCQGVGENVGECGGAGPPEKNHSLGARWALERKAMLMVQEAGVHLLSLLLVGQLFSALSFQRKPVRTAFSLEDFGETSQGSKPQSE